MFFGGGDPFGGGMPGGMGGRAPRGDVDTTKLYETLGVDKVHLFHSRFVRLPNMSNNHIG